MAENQHRQISGYREFDAETIALINEVKTFANEVDRLFERIRENGQAAPDARCLAIARTELQTGFMWLVRAVAKPQGF